MRIRTYVDRRTNDERIPLDTIAPARWHYFEATDDLGETWYSICIWILWPVEERVACSFRLSDAARTVEGRYKLDKVAQDFYREWAGLKSPPPSSTEEESE
jgi:hypothetical protein